MKLAAVGVCLVVAVFVGGCGGGSSSTTTDSSAAKVHAIEKLLHQAGAIGGSRDAGQVGGGGRVLTPQEAKKVLREIEAHANSGAEVENGLEKTLRELLHGQG